MPSIRETRESLLSTFEAQGDALAAVNLFDKATAIEGFYHGTTFAWTPSGAKTMAEFVPCSPGDVIRTKDDRTGGSAGSVNLVFKNAAGTVFAGQRITSNGSTMTFTAAPAGAVSFNISAHYTQLQSYVVTLNQAYPAYYIPYGTTRGISTALETALSSAEALYPRFGNLAVFNGDSITAGFNLTGYTGVNGVTPLEAFSTVTAETLGMGQRNYAISSSSIAVKSGDEATKTPIAGRYADMRNDADLVVIAGGTNDWYYAWTPLGTMADRTVYTFYGALHVLAAGLIEKYTGKQIVFMAPIKRGTDPDAVNSAGDTLQDYVAIIKEVCGYYSIPVLDMWAESRINPHIASQRTALIPDNTHPNAAGHALMAERLIGYLRTLA